MAPPPWIKDDGNGLSGRSLLKIVIPSILQLNPIPEIIFVARGGFPAEGRYAIENGALDYIQIPTNINDNSEVLSNPERIKDRLINAIQHGFNIIDGSYFDEIDLEGIVGQSWQIKRAILRLAQAAKTDSNVLITGETGTGKRLFAKKLHENRNRGQKAPFVIFDCKSDSESEAMTELLGSSTKRGKIDDAAGGTLFLYRIDSLPLSIQRKFLWVIQHRNNFEHTDDNAKTATMMLITATNCDLKALVAAGSFRDDLYYEIASFNIILPPLRNRKTDIHDIAKFHIDKICSNKKCDAQVDWSSDFIKVLEGYSWPGNIIELTNALQIAISNSGGHNPLDSFHLPSEIQSSGVSSLYYDSVMKNSGVLKTIFNLINNPGVSISEELLNEKKERVNEPTEDAVKVMQKTKNHIQSENKRSVQDEPDENPSKTINFYKCGDKWCIGHPKQEYFFDDTKGMKYIHHLLKHPGHEINCIDLYHLSKTPIPGDKPNREDELTDEKYQLHFIKNSADKKKIDIRIQELKTELEADDRNSADIEYQTDKFEILKQIEFLESELIKDSRFTKSEYNNARTNMQKHIKNATEKIFKEIPALKEYLEYPPIIKTGHLCSYNPRPNKTPHWILEPEDQFK